MLSMLPQPHTNESWLATTLPSWHKVRGLMHKFKAEGVSTRYCKVWEGLSVSAAWDLYSVRLSLSLLEA